MNNIIDTLVIERTSILTDIAELNQLLRNARQEQKDVERRMKEAIIESGALEFIRVDFGKLYRPVKQD